MPSMWDIHSHIIPCVDDGASSIEEALLMAKMAVAGGTRSLICTPHITVSPDIEADLDRISQVQKELALALKNANIELKLFSGAELILTSDLLGYVQKYPVLRLAGGDFFLFEITPYMPLHSVVSFLFAVSLSSFRPVFAHPERYPQVANDFAALQKIQESGALLQITAMSLTGAFGKNTQQLAEKIVTSFPESIILASDAHNTEFRTAELDKGLKALDKCSPLAYKAHEKNIERIINYLQN